MPDQVHLVIGATGEYEASEWIICAYPKEKDAKNHAEAANKSAAELGDQFSRWVDSEMDEKLKPAGNSYDRAGDEFVPGNRYRAQTVELRQRFKP